MQRDAVRFGPPEDADPTVVRAEEAFTNGTAERVVITILGFPATVMGVGL
ncbi:MAG TPA: hypothetical protein VFB43_01560 [Terracidiphilus sp.]|nr:hypothetical protein [Terracidiphilus sp.]